MKQYHFNILLHLFLAAILVASIGTYYHVLSNPCLRDVLMEDTYGVKHSIVQSDPKCLAAANTNAWWVLLVIFWVLGCVSIELLVLAIGADSYDVQQPLRSVGTRDIPHASSSQTTIYQQINVQNINSDQTSISRLRSIIADLTAENDDLKRQLTRKRSPAIAPSGNFVAPDDAWLVEKLQKDLKRAHEELDSFREKSEALLYKIGTTSQYPHFGGRPRHVEVGGGYAKALLEHLLRLVKKNVKANLYKEQLDAAKDEILAKNSTINSLTDQLAHLRRIVDTLQLDKQLLEDDRIQSAETFRVSNESIKKERDSFKELSERRFYFIREFCAITNCDLQHWSDDLIYARYMDGTLQKFITGDMNRWLKLHPKFLSRGQLIWTLNNKLKISRPVETALTRILRDSNLELAGGSRSARNKRTNNRRKRRRGGILLSEPPTATGPAQPRICTDYFCDRRCGLRHVDARPGPRVNLPTNRLPTSSTRRNPNGW